MKFRFRAAVRARVSAQLDAGGAGLLVRIHRDAGGSCFFDNMTERRITTGEWMFFDITGEVCSDAHDLELGLQRWGSGAAWMDDASLAFGASALLPKLTRTIELPKR